MLEGEEVIIQSIIFQFESSSTVQNELIGSLDHLDTVILALAMHFAKISRSSFKQEQMNSSDLLCIILWIFVPLYEFLELPF